LGGVGGGDLSLLHWLRRVFPPSRIRIPYRYATNTKEGLKQLTGTKVSIPHRYTTNKLSLSLYRNNIVMFRSLIGTLKIS